MPATISALPDPRLGQVSATLRSAMTGGRKHPIMYFLVLSFCFVRMSANAVHSDVVFTLMYHLHVSHSSLGRRRFKLVAAHNSKDCSHLFLARVIEDTRDAKDNPALQPIITTSRPRDTTPHTRKNEQFHMHRTWASSMQPHVTHNHIGC